MLTEERHRLILDLLAQKGVIKLQELVDATGASESTIRRDLTQLETEKKLRRVHGGAALLQQKREELSVSDISKKSGGSLSMRPAWYKKETASIWMRERQRGK